MVAARKPLGHVSLCGDSINLRVPGFTARRSPRTNAPQDVPRPVPDRARRTGTVAYARSLRPDGSMARGATLPSAFV